MTKDRSETKAAADLARIGKTIVVGKNCKEPEDKAAKILQEKIEDKTGLNLEIKGEDELGAIVSQEELFICLDSVQTPFPLVDRLIKKTGFNKDSLKDEDFVIKTIEEDGNLYVLVVGGSPLAVIFGVGKLLRSIKFSQGGFRIPETDFMESPFQEVKGTLITVHLMSRCYQEWNFEIWKDYITDLALWGIDTIFYTPLHFDEWSRAIWYGNKEEKAKWSLLGSKVPELIKSFGLKVGVHINFNDAFPEDFTRCKPAEMGDSEYIGILTNPEVFICPFPADSQEIILDSREGLFRELPYVDFVAIDITDSGGCACSSCRKGYLNLYLELCKEISGRLKKYHPEAKVVINTQALSKKGIDFFCQKVREDSDWLDYILYDCFGVTLPLKELRSKLPDKFRDKILGQPEITMRDGMGKRGAVPWVKEFDHAYEKSYDLVAIGGWDMNKNKYWHPEGCYLMLPDNLPRACNVEELNGAFSYSEGLHDDITKIIWAQKGWDPERNAVDILSEYCSWYFGEKARDKMVKAILKMEEISIIRPKFKTGGMLEPATKILELIESAEGEIPAGARDGWRWKMLLLRAKMEMLLASGGKDEKLKEEIIHLQEVLYKLTKTRFGPEEVPVGEESLKHLLEQDHKIYDLRKPIFKKIEEW